MPKPRSKSYLNVDFDFVESDGELASTETVRDLMYNIVKNRGGHIGDVDSYFDDIENNTYHVTVYWSEDPADQDPDPPHPEKTKAWLRETAAHIYQLLTQHRRVAIYLMTKSVSVEFCADGQSAVVTEG